MRRNTRRVMPYKSPRLFSMVALLVCLVLMMNSLRNMRGPGPLAQRIISNLDKSIKQVGVPAVQQAETQTPDATLPATQADAKPVDPLDESSDPASRNLSSPPEVDKEMVDAVVDQELPSNESNLSVLPNLNLREDLVLQDWLGLAQDGTLNMQKLEMPAYWRIMSVVKKSSFSDLFKAADSKMRFNDLYSSPSNQRSKLISLTVNIRKIIRYNPDENPAEVQELFEVWGWSETSKAWLYVFITPELPPGLDANTPVNQTVKFAGYFFKLQGYQPGAAKPNAKPLLAPLLIGKFELAKPAQRLAVQPDMALEWTYGAIILIVGVIAILLRVFAFGAKKPKLNRGAPSAHFDMFPDGTFQSRDEGKL